MNRTTTFALAALILMGAAQARAESVTVHVGGVSPQVAEKRIKTAALDVCGAPFGSNVQVVDEAKRSACYRQAVTTALASLPSTVKLASAR